MDLLFLANLSIILTKRSQLPTIASKVVYIDPTGEKLASNKDSKVAHIGPTGEKSATNNANKRPAHVSHILNRPKVVYINNCSGTFNF